jgi:hypothetical protein
MPAATTPSPWVDPSASGTKAGGDLLADRVIAVSQATKDEITWMCEVPHWKTSVVYNGVSPQRFD